MSAGVDVEPLDAGRRIWRRVTPFDLRGAPDDPERTVIAQGGAFRSRSGEDGSSVDLADVHEAAGHGPEALLASADKHCGVLEITIAACREAAPGYDVHVDAEPGNAAHALIKPHVGKKPSSRITKKARWVVTPPWPQPPGVTR